MHLGNDDLDWDVRRVEGSCKGFIRRKPRHGHVGEGNEDGKLWHVHQSAVDTDEERCVVVLTLVGYDFLLDFPSSIRPSPSDFEYLCVVTFHPGVASSPFTEDVVDVVTGNGRPDDG